MKMLTRLADKQFVRYLAVGAFNTAFGYGLFAALFAGLHGCVPEAHMIVFIISNVIAVAVAFLGYRYLVFRSRGPFVSELLRCYLVYSTSFFLGAALLYILVDRAGLNVYFAQAIITLITIVASFLGHRHFTFAPRDTPPPPSSS
jgi:putative flippase GtrA